jgi:CMP-N-acetylneuraminic acid synthetase
MDESNTRDVVDALLLFLSGQGAFFDAIITMCPVYPIRTFRHVENVLKSYLNQGNQRPLIGLKTPTTHPYSCYERDGKGHINNVMNIDENSFYRHQRYPEYYEVNFWACVVPVSSVKHLNALMMCSDSYGYIIPEHVPFVDIDTPLDFEFAEFLMQKIKSGKIKIDT